MRKVTIAGKEYELKYRFSDRREIEQRLGGRGIHRAMFVDGLLDDQMLILATGLRHANKKITPHVAMQMIEEHVESGQDWEHIIISAYAELIESRIFPGEAANQAALRELQKALGGEDEEGKDPTP